MSGIYIAALATAATAVAVFGPLIHRLRQPAEEWRLWLACVLVLPLQPLVFYAVRVPLDHWLVAELGKTSAVYRWLITFYAPLTEEPAKLVYQFGGYFSERLMTCVFHSAFVSVSLWQYRRRLALGLSGAMLLHWLGNLPLSLMVWNVGGLGKMSWLLIVQLWLLLYFLAAAGLLSWFSFGRLAPTRLFYGRRRCPECAAEYDAPLLAFNLGSSRYDRCPHCRHWHWTKASGS